MSVHEETTPAPRRPSQMPWLNSPDAPPKPDLEAHRAETAKLVAKRRALIDEVKALQSSMQKDPASVARDEELSACRERLNAIDEKRRVTREQRAKKDGEIARLRKKRSELAENLRGIQAEVGGFKSVKEIDEATEYLMQKMESSGGGLAAEKRNQHTLHRLQQAKLRLAELQPLTEAIKEVTDQETVLQQEYLAISEQIGIYSKAYDEEMQKKRELSKVSQIESASRSEIYKKRAELSNQIEATSQSLEALHVEFGKTKDAYDTWFKEARDKYFAKQNELREQRRRDYEERINAHKIAAKKERAAKRQNPHVIEISACTTLIQYLKQKKMMVIHDEEERKKREAAAHFDPAQVAPAGCVVLNDGKWSDNKPLSKTAKKQQKQQQKQKEKASAAKVNNDAAPPAAENKDRMLQHPEDKIRLFQMIEVEPVLSLGNIDEKIQQIEEKKKKYEEQIQTGDLVLSSGDDEEEEAPLDASPQVDAENPEVSAAAAEESEKVEVTA